MTNSQLVIFKWANNIIISFTVFLAVLDFATTYGYLLDERSEKRYNIYKINKIIDEFWSLIVMIVATGLISISIFKLKKTIDNLNSYNNILQKRQRYKLNQTTTIVHIGLLLAVIVTGVMQLEVILVQDADNIVLDFRL